MSSALPPDVVEPWGSSHDKLSRSPRFPGDAVATPQWLSGRFRPKKKKTSSESLYGARGYRCSKQHCAGHARNTSCRVLL
ncbi:jg4564 [Pararge aegeria aegeria]|uniref:Jg4564 protein n=1 Tax=Pararge aegeria aegeria TaxID=348720 RepID=A0A8S4RSA5_9NEOP|nr:jg4564 [Pararge aegeria aegeria]